MLGRQPKTGEVLPLAMFDPLTRTVKKVNLRIQKDSVFTVIDSASFDSTTGRWVKAHEEIVRGWLITGDVPTLTAWVDAQGRMIAASEPGGISLMRIPFEMAFDNWRLDRAATRSAVEEKRTSVRTRK
jgi:hypothetical protein